MNESNTQPPALETHEFNETLNSQFHNHEDQVPDNCDLVDEALQKEFDEQYPTPNKNPEQTQKTSFFKRNKTKTPKEDEDDESSQGNKGNSYLKKTLLSVLVLSSLGGGIYGANSAGVISLSELKTKISSSLSSEPKKEYVSLLEFQELKIDLANRMYSVDQINSIIDGLESKFIEKINEQNQEYLELKNQYQSAISVLESIPELENKVEDLRGLQYTYVSNTQFRKSIDSLLKDVRRDIAISENKILEQNQNKSTRETKVNHQQLEKKKPTIEQQVVQKVKPKKSSPIKKVEHNGYTLYETEVWGGTQIASVVFNDKKLIQRKVGERLSPNDPYKITSISLYDGMGTTKSITLVNTKTKETVILEKG